MRHFHRDTAQSPVTPWRRRYDRPHSQRHHLISGLGLYGLVSLIAVQRTKEIGIRKVLGASLRQIFSMMSGDFIRLVFRGLLIALPIAGFIINTWSSDDAYHGKLNSLMFLIQAIVV